MLYNQKLAHGLHNIKQLLYFYSQGACVYRQYVSSPSEQTTHFPISNSTPPSSLSLLFSYGPNPPNINLLSVMAGTQLVQHCGISQSILQSTTNVWRGSGRRSHTFSGIAPWKLLPERPIKPVR